MADGARQSDEPVERDLSVFGTQPLYVAGGIFVVALLGRLAYWSRSGTTEAAISSTFLEFCGYGLTDYIQYLISWEGAELILYAGYWVPLCGVTTVTGGSLHAMVGFQILLSSLACVIVFYTGLRHIGPIAGVVAGLSLAVLFDMFVWTTRILGDSTLVFVVAATIWAIGRYRENPIWKNRLLVWGCLGYLAVTRPYGAPIALGWVLYDLSNDPDVRLDIVPDRRIVVGVAAIGLPLLSILLVARWGHVMVDFWSRGVLVADDPAFPRYPFVATQETEVLSLIDQVILVSKFIAFNIHHIVVMGIIKIGVFFLPVVPRFSLLHNVINLLTYTPIYLLGFVGLFRIYRQDRELFRQWVTPLLVILFIISLTFTDYSWGYRAPTGPIFALLAGYAVATDSRITRLLEIVQNRID